MSAVALPDRKRALILLAEHLYESLAGPKGQRFHAGKGQAAPSHYEPCRACGGEWISGPHTGIRYGYRRGTGWIVDRFHRKRPCEDCGGLTLEDGTRKPGSGRVGMDRMTGRKVGTEEDTNAAVRSTSWTCNFCHGRGVERGVGATVCVHCSGSGKREHSPFVLHGVSDEGDAIVDDPDVVLERAIMHRDEEGDFHRLEAALSILAAKSTHQWRVFHGLHVVKTVQDFDLDFQQRVWLQQAYAALLNMMPAEIRVPRDLVYAEEAKRKQRREVRGRVDVRALGDRNAWMRERFAAGELGIAELIQETGLSRRQVYEVLYGETA